MPGTCTLQQWAIPKSPSMPPSASMGLGRRNGGRRSGGREREGEDEAEKPDKGGRGCRAAWWRERCWSEAEAQRTRQRTLDLRATPPPFKARLHSRQDAQGMALGNAVPGHQLPGGLVKGFLSCPSVSPSGSEEIGPNDPLKQPSHHHGGPSRLHLLPERRHPSPTVPASAFALLQLQPIQHWSQSCPI